MSRSESGVRAGAILLASSLAVAASSYLYNLICIRWLGAKGYGDVAALTALTMIVFLPLTGVQAAISREVAILRARTADDEITALIGKIARVGGLVAGAAALLVAVSA